MRVDLVLGVIIGAIYLVPFLSSPTLGAGWFWDAGNSLGFAAMAGVLYLTLATGPGLDVRVHRQLGYAVLGVAVGHALWLLVGDPTIIEYLKPGAPAYMWAGVIGLLLLTALTIIAMPRVRLKLHKHYAGFRLWHRIIAILTIVGSAWHVVGSNYYLDSWYSAVVFVAIVTAVSIGHRRFAGIGNLNSTITREFLIASAGATLIFVGLRNLLQ